MQLLLRIIIVCLSFLASCRGPHLVHFQKRKLVYVARKERKLGSDTFLTIAQCIHRLNSRYDFNIHLSIAGIA